MSPLVQAALDLLEDANAVVGLRSVACTTLLASINAGLEIPDRTAMAVWRYLLHSDAPASALHTYEIPSADVARDAVRILTSEPDAGENARDLAMAVLRGDNVAVVTEADLLLMAESVVGERRTRRFTFLVESVHELNGLSSGFLQLLRDRLAASSSAVVRAAGADLGALLPRLDELFTERMLTDPSPVVRRTALELLERVGDSDRSKAAAIVRRHLGSAESNRIVVAAGLSALGALVRRETEAH